MKSLKPSLREKKRYLLVEGKNLKLNIPLAIKDFIGVLGVADTSLKTIKFGENWAIISINKKMLDKVRASFSVWSEKIEVKKVSGTLKGLKTLRTK
ncbi:hypothetical protein HN832_03200 [archaeon]|jgi:RNase P/RNase MRP subunit POP5|nr:hypothetical protein [archaeon]MBT4373597.1 hypothetical protein [archaeon]MBT4532045.1 hypothetical protein [archaeon]MBT7001712.1 hypothetical protein [archaeon]MBT7282396.1 hypothetical protein [archaeon]